MTDEAKRMLTYFEDHAGCCMIEGRDAEGRKTVALQACGDAAIETARALSDVPGREEYDIAPCPTFDDESAVLVTLDNASVLVEPHQWAVTPCESFHDAANDQLHHGDARRLGHLLLFAAGIAAEAEAEYTRQCREAMEEEEDGNGNEDS